MANVTATKTYSNHIGRKFHQFFVVNDTETRYRTFDVCVRKGRRELETMSKAEAKARAAYLFEMGDEIEGMTQQLVYRIREHGERDLDRCFGIVQAAGLLTRWIEWLERTADPLIQVTDIRVRFEEFAKREMKLWA